MPMFTWGAEEGQSHGPPSYQPNDILAGQRVAAAHSFHGLTTITKRAGATKAQMAPLANDSQQLQSSPLVDRSAGRFWKRHCGSSRVEMAADAEPPLLTCPLGRSCSAMTTWTPRRSAEGSL